MRDKVGLKMYIDYFIETALYYIKLDAVKTKNKIAILNLILKIHILRVKEN